MIIISKLGMDKQNNLDRNYKFHLVTNGNSRKNPSLYNIFTSYDIYNIAGVAHSMHANQLQ